MIKPKNITTRQAAEILGCDESTVRRLVRKGELPAVCVQHPTQSYYTLDPTVVKQFSKQYTPKRGRPRKEG